MQTLIVKGGKKLYGEVKISPAKNACLPILSAAILIDGRVRLNPCPYIDDVLVMAKIIKELGGGYDYTSGRLTVDCSGLDKYEGNCNTYAKARASFFTAGAIISRFGRAVIPLPGGCDLGARPIDIHLEALQQLNITHKLLEGCVFFDGRAKRAGKIKLKYPSVGATVNVINASVYTAGQTVISNCAKEPEIKDLCDFLNGCGCKIWGGGSNQIVIEGVKPISTNLVEYSPIYDRIEAGTYMFAVGACGGELAFECNDIKPIFAICNVLKKCGALLEFANNTVKLCCCCKPKPIKVCADVYPAFPTDMQAQLCSYLSMADGVSRVRDKVFPNRFAYLNELKRFGMQYRKVKNEVTIRGVKQLVSASATVTDLRGGAALLISALAAEGVSKIQGAHILDRGYESLQEKLNGIGASVKRIKS